MDSRTYVIVAVIVFCCVAVENVESRSARSVPELRPDLHRRYRRIVGGDIATPHSWPWMAYVQCDKCKYFCGGSLVASKWVLTAAHCAQYFSIAKDKIFLGAHNVTIREVSQQRKTVAAKYIHPLYNPNTLDYDVALLKLRLPATINRYVSLANMIGQNKPVPVRARCVVTGWGTTETGRSSDVLRKAGVPVVSRAKCQTFWPDIGQEVLCAGGSGMGICNGDSGGPLNCYLGSQWTQVGVVSFGKNDASGRCDPYVPDGHIKVAKVRDFIDSKINPP